MRQLLFCSVVVFILTSPYVVDTAGAQVGKGEPIQGAEQYYSGNALLWLGKTG